MLTPWKKSYNQPRQHIKKQRYYFANKGPSSQSYGFSSSHVWMWELYHKESWVLKNWYFWTVVLEKTLGSPLDFKENKSVNPKENQPWIFIGRVDAEASILWTPDDLIQRTDSLEKTLMLGKIAGRRRKGQQRMRWMASPTWWTWVWSSFRNWWWTGKPGVLQSWGCRAGHDRVTELNWFSLFSCFSDSLPAYHLVPNFLPPPPLFHSFPLPNNVEMDPFCL